MANGDYATQKNVLKWVAILVGSLIVAVGGVITQNNLDSNKRVQDKLESHESRIVKTETCIQYMASDISEIKELTKDIRRDQVRRDKAGK